VHLSIDQDWAEERLAAEPDSDPLESFDRHWAFSLLKTVFKRLEDNHDRTGKRELYEAIAARLGISHEGALRCLQTLPPLPRLRQIRGTNGADFR